MARGQSEKQLLIRVSADLKQAVNELRSLGEEIKGTGENAGKSGNNFQRLVDRLEPAAAAARKLKQETALLDAEYKKGNIDLKKHTELTRKLGDEQKRSSKNSTAAGNSLQFLKRSVAAYLTVRFVQQLVMQADAFNVLQARIKNATRETGDYNRVTDQLFRNSQRNGAELSATVDVFQRLTLARADLGATNQELVQLTDLVQKLGVVSGASKTALQAGLLQFGQGLSSGIFRAEEFNSILENMPAVAQKIATGLGKSPGELRKMVINGKLLSRDVMRALLSQSEDIHKEFSDMPLSVERATTSLSNSFSHFIAQLDQASGITAFIARSMQSISDSLSGTPERMDVLISRLEKLQSTSANFRGLNARGQRSALNAEIEQAKQDINDALIAIGGPTGLRLSIDRVDQELSDLEDKLAGTSHVSGGHAGRQRTALVNQIESLRVEREKLLKSLADTELGTGKGSTTQPVSPTEIARLQNIEKITAALKDEAATVGMTKDEIAIYRLQVLGATDAQLALARASIATTKAENDNIQAKKDGQAVYEATRTDMEKLSVTMERLDKLYELGAFGAVGSAKAFDTYSRAIFNATDQLDNLKDTGKNTMDELIAATKGWGNEFTNTLVKMVQTGKLNFSDLADSIIADLLKIMIYQNITKPILGAFGLSAGTNHTGGLAGTGASKIVSPLVFAGAPRYHTGGFAGLQANEVPAILQKNEEVLTTNDPRHAFNLGKGGAQTMKVEIINRGTPAEVSSVDRRVDPEGAVLTIMMQDLNKGGPYSAAVAGKFGLKRKGR